MNKEAEEKLHSLAERRRHGTRSSDGIRSLDAPHTTDDAPWCRESRELGATEVTDIVTNSREPAKGDCTELQGVFDRVDGFVRQSSLDTHVDQALELILLRLGCFGVEEVQHLLGVGIVLDFHVPLDGSSDAVDPMLRLDGQGCKVAR
jgi:hypothetical protein